MGTLQQLIENL